MSCCYPSSGITCATGRVAKVPGVSLDTIVGAVAVCVVDYGFGWIDYAVSIRVLPRNLAICNNGLAGRSDSWTCQNVTCSSITHAGAGGVETSHHGVDTRIKHSVGIIVNKPDWTIEAADGEASSISGIAAC